MSEWDASRRFLTSTAVLALVLAACASVDRNPNVVSAYSDKLSPYNYKEEGTLVRMVVGVEAARFIRDEHYFPLFLQVSNRSKMTFLVTRESFTLEDPLGNQYSIVPARELAENYPRLDLDRRLFRQNRQFTLNGLDLFTYVESGFYPSPSSRSLLVDTVSLPPRTYLEDVLYFPIPQSGLNGVPLRLLFKVRGLDEAIEVVFEVPRTLGILEKNKDKEKDKKGEDR
jgi:hypothetical protein